MVILIYFLANLISTSYTESDESFTSYSNVPLVKHSKKGSLLKRYTRFKRMFNRFSRFGLSSFRVTNGVPRVGRPAASSHGFGSGGFFELAKTLESGGELGLGDTSDTGGTQLNEIEKYVERGAEEGKKILQILDRRRDLNTNGDLSDAELDQLRDQFELIHRDINNIYAEMALVENENSSEDTNGVVCVRSERDVGDGWGFRGNFFCSFDEVIYDRLIFYHGDF